MWKSRNEEIASGGFKIKGIEKRGFNHDPKSGFKERPAPPKPIKTRPLMVDRSPKKDQ